MLSLDYVRYFVFLILEIILSMNWIWSILYLQNPFSLIGFMILPILGKWITSTLSITAKKNSVIILMKFSNVREVLFCEVLLKRLHKITVHAIYILILSFYIYWPMTIFLLVCDHITEGQMPLKKTARHKLLRTEKHQ